MGNTATEGSGRTGHLGLDRPWGDLRLSDCGTAPGARRLRAHGEHRVSGPDASRPGWVPRHTHGSLADGPDAPLLSPHDRRPAALPGDDGELEDGFQVPIRVA